MNGAVLRTIVDEAYARLRGRLEGLTDEEFFWQPVPDCWTIYREESGRWRYHYAIPEPAPAPVTTIGWQLVHLALCKVMYHEWAFGPARLTWPELEVPHTAAGAIAVLERGQSLLRGELERLPDRELGGPRLTNWGDTWPAWRVFWVMADHDAFHGGMIGQQRDLYRWSMRQPGDNAGLLG